MDIVEFANSVDPDEATHYEPPHPDLPCLPSSLWIFYVMYFGQGIFF